MKLEEKLLNIFSRWSVIKLGTMINYNIRPSKSIERKMICETFRKIRRFGFPQSYRYIGFGAKYFTDFILFHKELGINDMISIEKNTDNRSRYEYNKPFGCIRLEFGKSTDVLPRLDWPIDKKSIIWLDYDQKFQPFMLDDIKIALPKLVSGSIFIITCNRVIGNEISDIENDERLNYIKSLFGTRVPIDTKERDLVPKKSFSTIKKIIDNNIDEALYEINSGRDDEGKLNYKQLFYFTYSDGAPMMTLGGILFEEADREKYDKCRFFEEFYICDGDTPFEIDIPILTYKEINALNSKLPTDNIQDIAIPGISNNEIENYMKLYKYFPYYTEIYSQ
ncbi:hypothetical protein HMPREF1982_00776 [Clostridiales bacterium oral taxon 876 str. F0540]|nr:hypothetical protein HMPREF1982_00776 [Clostridiales bacterium oral taxon 876 str. F0540]